MTVAIDPMAELAICLLMKQAVPKGDVLGAGRARQEEERAGGNEKLMSHALFPMCVGRDQRGSQPRRLPIRACCRLTGRRRTTWSGCASPAAPAYANAGAWRSRS